jgi:CO/xanthine dehydrogenase FAD-binding subunit
VEHSALVQKRHPIVIDVLKHIGHMQIRNRGTVAGSIAHADPAAELPALLSCLNGEVVIQSVQGEHVLKAGDFFTGYLSTALEPGEMVTEVRFPWLAPQAGWAFLEFARRSGDYALVGVVAVLTPTQDDRCKTAHIAYLGIAGQPVRAHEVENAITGTNLGEETIQHAAALAAGLVSDDMEDVHATVEYRRALAVEYTKRALQAAWERRGHGKVDA